MSNDPYLCDDDTCRLADAVRREHHPELDGAEIAYVFLPKAPVSAGRVRMGKAQKLAPVAAMLADKDFAIVLSSDVWKDLSLPQRQALLDHELCHCAPRLNADGDRVGWQKRHHTLEDFNEVVARHGVQFPSQKRYAEELARQLQLQFEEATTS